MASIRKIGNKWQAQVRVKGFKGAHRFHTKLEAQEWAFEMERRAGKHGKILTTNTLGDAMEKFSNEISPTHKGERWEQIRLRKLKRDPIAHILLSKLTTQDLQNWIERQQTASASIRRELNLIQSVLRHCRTTWRWMHDDITKDLIKPPPSRHRNRRIWPDEESAIVAQLGYKEDSPLRTNRQKLAVAFLFALETGMRQGEIWKMDWKYINQPKRFVTLPDTKNGSSREVPLSSRALVLLDKLTPKEEGLVFSSKQESASAEFRKAVKKCNIENLRFHDTRHEACTRLAKKYNVAQLAKVIGHKNLNSLQIYHNPTGEELARLLD
ncbi:MAG: site-specific integrase [Bacteroidetes bacterium]|nr:MAG: site-specific integrase [Bacteroidota bacterium]